MRCINCNKEIEGKSYEVRIQNESIGKVTTCSKDCQKYVRNYQEDLRKNQTVLFILLGVGVVLNLISVAFFPSSNVNYLILAAMSICIFFQPYIFIRFRSFSKLGIQNTMKRIKHISIGLFVLSIFFFFVA